MSRNHRRLNKKLWAHCRFVAFAKANFRCERCGRAGKLEGHHKAGLDHGGAAYDPDNVETLCKNCHLELSVFAPRLQWARYLKHTYKDHIGA